MIARVACVTNTHPAPHARATHCPTALVLVRVASRRSYATPRRPQATSRHASHHTRDYDARMMCENHARVMIARVMRVTNGHPAPHVRAINRPCARRIAPRHAAPHATSHHATPRITRAIMTRSRRARIMNAFASCARQCACARSRHRVVHTRLRRRRVRDRAR